jgi:hypothetical protein
VDVPSRESCQGRSKRGPVIRIRMRESFNEAMLSLNSAQFVEIRLIYKKCVLRPRDKRLAYG